jgi:hypothetical protein
LDNIYTLSNILAFGENEILKYVDNNTLAEIKKTDPKPLLKAFTIAHEGTTKPKVLGTGYRVMQWGRSAIESVYDALQVGIKSISGHTADNNPNSKPEKATVIGKGKQLIDNVLHTIAVLYFPNKNDSDYNTISMEAQVMHDDNPNNSIVDSVKNITALALGKLGLDSPAFPNAKEIASIQCFDDAIGSAPLTNRTLENGLNKFKIEDNKKMPTQEEVREYLRTTGFPVVKDLMRDVIAHKHIFPSQIFLPEEIIGTVKTENGDLQIEGGDKELVAYIKRPLNDVRKSYDQKIIEFEKNLKNVQKENIKLSAGTMIQDVVKEKKLSLSEKQSKFITAKMKEFEPGEDVKKSLSEFVDKKLEEFKEIDAIYNPVTEANLGNAPLNTDGGANEDKSLSDKDYL